MVSGFIAKWTFCSSLELHKQSSLSACLECPIILSLQHSRAFGPQLQTLQELVLTTSSEGPKPRQVFTTVAIPYLWYHCLCQLRFARL